MTDEPQGEPCPKCGEPMSMMRGGNLKLCATGCKHEQFWPLDEGQKPLINTSRGDRKQ